MRASNVHAMRASNVHAMHVDTRHRDVQPSVTREASLPSAGSADGMTEPRRRRNIVMQHRDKPNRHYTGATQPASQDRTYLKYI